MTSTLKTIRWGILGTGTVARDFVQGLRSIEDASPIAVASRTLEKAQSFAQQFAIPKPYGSYAELVADPEIDVVYVATPHTRHKQDCILCLEAGKPVLCEKPFAVSAAEACEVIQLARQRQLFCMEAMWMRFMPLMQKVRELIRSGAIGEVRMLTAEFGYPTEFDPENRFFNPKLGGGALLDRGVYPLSLAFDLFGEPTQVSSQAAIGSTGVDEQSAMVLEFLGGKLALLSASLCTRSSNAATIVGTLGKIQIHEPFYCPEKISLTQFPKLAPVAATAAPNGSSGLKQKLRSVVLQAPRLHRVIAALRDTSITFAQPTLGNGYGYEAIEVGNCLRRGDLESQIMPLDETLRILTTLDRIRQQWKPD
jgi:predicted dehydrogenase